MAVALRRKTKNELRCFCRGAPLLATYGIDEDGSLYVHVKVHKQGRIFGETYHTGGVVRIRCRNCFRWNRVTFVSSGPAPEAKLEEASPPEAVGENSPGQ
jgi:hypothetical protein